MSFERAVEDALDRHGRGPGTVGVRAGGAEAEVEVVESDRLGVRVCRVKVKHAADRDLHEEAKGLPERLASLPTRLEPVEVDPTLGGAVLRGRPEERRQREFWQVDLRGREAELRRMRPKEGGGRDPVDFTLTREQLGRLLDEMEGSTK